MDARIARDGWRAGFVTGLGQALVSGNLAAARTALMRDAKEVGLWAVTQPGLSIVRVARDRAVVVTDTPLSMDAGWRNAGFAVTPADGIYAVVEISGRMARHVVEQAVSADLDAESPSAAVLFAGFQALVYRTSDTTVRVHVEAGYAAALWLWLESLPD